MRRAAELAGPFMTLARHVLSLIEGTATSNVISPILRKIGYNSSGSEGGTPWFKESFNRAIRVELGYRDRSRADA